MNLERGLKILASNREVGSLLGPGGQTLKRLREKVSCKIFISEKSYPLMDIRCIYILGSERNVIECQKFILCVIAKVREFAKSESDRGAPSKKLTWDDETDTVEQYMHVQLDLKIAIPIQCESIVSDSLHKMQRVSGVESVSSLPSSGGMDAAELTMERVLAIRASCYQCVLFLQEIVKLMAANTEVSGYHYGSNFSSQVMMAASHRGFGGTTPTRPAHSAMREDVRRMEDDESIHLPPYLAGRRGRPGGGPPTEVGGAGRSVPLPSVSVAFLDRDHHQSIWTDRSVIASTPPQLQPPQQRPRHIQHSSSHEVPPTVTVPFAPPQRSQPFAVRPNPVQFYDIFTGAGAEFIAERGRNSHDRAPRDEHEEELNELFRPG